MLGSTKNGANQNDKTKTTTTIKNDLESLQQKVKDFSENYSKIKVESKNQ